MPPTLWHRAKVDAGGEQFGSRVDHCRACNDDVPVEYERPEDVVLGLQVALEGSSHEAGATDFTHNPMTL